MPTPVVIHGHFYQPPRENPWTGAVEREPSAHPAHDWNERVHRECYRPNAQARILDGYGRIERLVNNYAHISFNFGPTLLSWMEARDPATYGRILEADRLSARRLGGHGNAIAQGYNHAILPLCNERDRRTQVRWGLTDFQRRFGRRSESIWLPETACNDATLDLLIDEGVTYVILSPHQAERVRRIGDEGWRSVADGSIDPAIPYRRVHRDGSGRSIAIFFYDGPIARSIAFEGALVSSQSLVERLKRGGGGDDRLVHVATDGESYGHHFHFGDRTLAYALTAEARSHGLEPTNYGAFLAAHPPTMEVEIKAGPDGEGTAWSCAHGVGRWARDCGCSTGAREGWSQAWRAPLRAALDLLRDEAAARYEELGGALLADPWGARDAYAEVFLDPARPHRAWLRGHARGTLGEDDAVRALTLLEMQRYAQLMYTSCGWFFADVAGIETVQIMKYAGRVLDGMEELGMVAPRSRFLEILGEARSNRPSQGSGADVYNRQVPPLRVSPRRVAGHLGISTLAGEPEAHGVSSGYRFRRANFQSQTHGRLSLTTSRLELEDAATGRRHDYAVAAMHFGGVDFYCVLKDYPGPQRYQASADTLWSHFHRASLPAMLRMTQEEFGPEEYGLECVLPEGRERISERIFGEIIANFADEYVHLYETNQRVLDMLQEAGFELPRRLRAAAEFTLGRRFEEQIRAAHGSRDPAVYQKAIRIAREAAHHGYDIDRSAVSQLFGEMLSEAIGLALASPTPEALASATSLVELARQLGADEELLDRPQALLYSALDQRRGWPPAMQELALALGFAPSVAAPAVVSA